MNRNLVPTTAVLIALTTACGPVPDGEIPDSYRSVLPDSRVEISLDADYSGSARSLGEMADGYLFTAKVTRDVNGLIRNTLATIDTVTDQEPTWASFQDNTAVWGPYHDGLSTHEAAVWVHYDEPTDVYTWVVAGREVGSQDWDDFTPFVLGQVNEGATEDDNDGWFFWDFTTWASMDPTSDAAGKFAVTYDVNPDDVEATAAFEDFYPEATEGPINAVYHYAQDLDGGRMDLVFEADIHGDGSAAEKHAMRTRWLADGSGRSDSAIAEGDLVDFVGVQSECWGAAPDFGRSYYANNWDATQMEGEQSDCVFSDEEFSEDGPSAP